ncbi:oligoendopeptidase F [Peribacillus frigoritolerans]
MYNINVRRPQRHAIIGYLSGLGATQIPHYHLNGFVYYPYSSGYGYYYPYYSYYG